MKIADLKPNDVSLDSGINVSLWMQGCPIRCKNCHNPQTWNPHGGIEVSRESLKEKIFASISANNIQRNFSVLGGEPLAPYNIQNTAEIIQAVREKYPNITIYLWTGYVLHKLNQLDPNLQNILTNTDIIIEGPYIDSLRNLSLPLRGSENQKILYKSKDF